MSDFTPPPVVLLGAGASIEAGALLTADLTRAIAEAVTARDRLVKRALDYVLGSMIGYKSRYGTSPLVLPNIEELVSAVELLASRKNLEVAPFIERWEPTVESLERPLPMSAQQLGRGLSSALELDRLNRPRDPDKAGELILLASGGGPVEQTFHRLRAALVTALVQTLTIDESRTSYLAPLTSPSDGVRTIATLNYDPSLEVAAAAAGHHISCGVSEWQETGELYWPVNHTRVLHLHGSFTWSQEHSSFSDTRTPQQIPALVFGQRDKLQARGPFLQLFEEFRAALNRSDRLVAIGYSFGDGHVNEVIGRWLRRRDVEAKRRLLVVDPYFFEPSWGVPRGPALELWRAFGPNASNQMRAMVSKAAEGIARLAAKPTVEYWDSMFAEPHSIEGVKG